MHETIVRLNALDEVHQTAVRQRRDKVNASAFEGGYDLLCIFV
jgi:hypothetical protein